ncbi:condensation domain-containing protein, partial [Streptomyces sp. NPDC050704]|uniref:condensation domain-containing protein n=1 Tax=Streptomyces sp. NPDC050704 TaxID=3157219 RepID=UPI003447C786
HWVLVTVFHHAVCDGWSMGIIWHDLQELYRARRDGGGTQLAPPTAQFTDCARAEHELSDGRRAELERFWRTELDGAPLRLDLPYDRPHPGTLSGRGALHTWVVDGDTPARIADTATRLGTTPYTVLAAAFAAWAAALCGRPTDVVLAASSANRLRRERSDVVGMLGDAVLLRARLGEAETFADLVTQLSSTLFSALDHQELPLTEVAELVSPGSTDGLFPTVLFTVVTTPPPALDLGAVSATVRGLDTVASARNELYAVLSPDEEFISVTFEYSTELFDSTTIETWGRTFTRFLEEITKDPEYLLQSLFHLME